MNGKVNYHFKLLDRSDYELSFKLKVSGNILNAVFVKALEKHKEKTGKDTDANLKVIQRFEVDQRFYNLVKTSLLKQLKQVIKEVGKDKIIVMTDEVKKVVFQKDLDSWLVEIIIGGVYVDKRTN